MAVSKKVLEREIREILKDADLEAMSSKKVRLQLEETLSCDLLSRKKEIDEIVLSCINEREDDEDDEEGSSDAGSDYSEEASPKKKRASTGKKATPAKKRKYDSDDDEDDAGSDSGSDYKPTGYTPKAKGKKKSKKASDDDSDDDYKAPKKAKAKEAAGGGGAKKGRGFTRAYKLSPELAELMGAESLARHEVVKKVWEMIKSRNLYDPKNKQFAICDDDLLKVMGVKRFRTFGMLKHLKSHFITN